MMGGNWLDEAALSDGEVHQYVLNTNSRRFHLPDCPSVADTKPENRQDYEGTRELLIAQGYQPCGSCNP